MSGLKDLKRRISSVKSTQKMTKAMKMVATSKMRKAKIQAENSRPYAEKILEIILPLALKAKMQLSGDERPSLLTGRNVEKNILIVIFTSDRGLCGSINSVAVKGAKKLINEFESENKNVKLLCIGKKGYEQMKYVNKSKIIDQKLGLFRNNIVYADAEIIADQIIELFENNTIDSCYCVYSKFKSAIAQDMKIKKIIPIELPEKEEIKLTNNSILSPIEYEPEEKEILKKLLPKNLAIQIYNELLENFASEQGARMAAMESATKNAGEMIKSLTLTYNRTRQANITSELIDIISGANAT